MANRREHTFSLTDLIRQGIIDVSYDLIEDSGAAMRTGLARQ